MDYLLVLVLGVATAAVATNVTARGHPSCRCITDAESANDTYRDIDTYRSNGAGWNSSGRPTSGYGIGCGKHDAAPPYFQKQCDADNQPEFCTDQWCYVTHTCLLSSSSSKFRVGRAFSYATCGYSDKHASTMSQGELSGLSLNSVHMTNSGGWKDGYCKNEKNVSTCTGPVYETMRWAIAESGALENIMHTLYSSPLTEYPDAYPREVLHQVHLMGVNSAFTACLYATSMGYVDVCIGAFAQSPSRQLISTHMIPLYAEPVYLVTTTRTEDESFWPMMSHAFKPFQPEVWAAVITFFVLVSCMLALLERGEGGIYEEESFLASMVHASFFGVKSFFEGGLHDAIEAQSVSGRVIGLGFAILLFFFISAYTANLATTLIVKNREVASIGSWKDLLADPNHKVCSMIQLGDFLKVELHLPEARWVGGDRHETIASVGTSTCAAAAVTLEDLQQAQKDGSFCNLMRIGDHLTTVEWVAPVSARAARAMKYHMVQGKMSGRWHAALKKFRPIDGCPKVDASDADSGDATGLRLRDMAGPFVIAAVVCIVGVLCGLGRKIIRSRRGFSDRRQKVRGKRSSQSSHPGANANLVADDVRAVVEEMSVKLQDLQRLCGAHGSSQNQVKATQEEAIAVKEAESSAPSEAGSI